MKNLETLQDYVDAVIDIRKHLSKTYGLKFAGKSHTGHIWKEPTESQLFIDTAWANKGEIRKNGSVILTFDQLKQYVADTYPQLTAEPVMSAIGFGLRFIYTPTKYLRIAYVQLFDDAPVPVYVWNEDEKSYVYTYSSDFQNGCHYTGEKGSVVRRLFDTQEEATAAYRDVLETAISDWTDRIQHAQQTRDGYIKKLEELNQQK